MRHKDAEIKVADAVESIYKNADILREKGVEVDIYFSYSSNRMTITNCIVSFKPQDRFRYCYSCTSKSVKNMAAMLKDMVATCENGRYKYVRSSGINSAMKNGVLWQM